MSTWSMHEITVTLAADLHCGDLPLGFVSRTLPFVPPHIPWYALVNATARSLDSNVDNKVFGRVEELFLQGIRFSPFFIQEQDDTLFPFLPHCLDRIENNYLDSSYGVALNYNNREAMENHLFERECILYRSRKTGYSTTLKGYVFWKEAERGALYIDHEAKIGTCDFSELFIRSQWGGERNKGWGTLRDVELKSRNYCFGAGVDLKNTNPILMYKRNTKVPFYLACQNEKYNHIHGSLRPLTGRRFLENKGSGLRMDDTRIVWDIGWESFEDVCIELIDHRTANIH